MPELKKGKLILEDGSIYEGFSFGGEQSTAGEVVFTTGMVGYPESLTDPSYHGQILTFTYPLLGNYGVPREEKDADSLMKNFESEKIQVKGVIVSDHSNNHNHWSSIKSLEEWLIEHRIPGLYGIDTRQLTKKIREQGVMLGKIIIDNQLIDFSDPNTRNLVAEVSCKEKIVYEKGPTRVLLVDCGVKHSLIKSFLKRNITVIRVPWNYDFFQEEYNGLFISNGPGDPKQCRETILNLKKALHQNKPILGICLGSQLLALAAGANTYKLKYGHRGQNQPCVKVGTKKCQITSQNHGYAVEEKTLPEGWEPWFTNLNDNTNEGIRHENKPFFAVQFHPEANPGPLDTDFLFDKFVELLNGNI